MDVKWLKASETLPELEKDVLIYTHWGFEVKHLKKTEGLNYKREAFSFFSFYPGGSPIENTYWAELPKAPL